MSADEQPTQTEPGDDPFGGVPATEAAFLHALDAYAGQSLMVIDGEGHMRLPWGFHSLLGYEDPGALDGHHLAEFTHPDDIAAGLTKIEQIAAGVTFDRPATGRARRADGSWCLVELSMFDARDDPVLGGVVLRVRVLPEPTGPQPMNLVAMEPLAEALSSGVLAANRVGEVVYANRAAAHLFGLPSHRLLHHAWRELVHDADRGEFDSAGAAVLDSLNPHDLVFRVMVADGGTRWVHARLSPLHEDGPAAAGWVAVLEDVTAQRATEADLAHRATHDPLTGLPNRLLLHDRLEQAIARLTRADDHVAVMFLDIDKFKVINDQYGHAAGDATLVGLADRIQHAIRPGDTAARVGGDEFVIIADDVDEARAVAIAERVAAAVKLRGADSPVPVEISTSIGVALAGPGETVDEILSLADQAMYRAKRKPGHSVVVATSPPPG